MCTPTCTFIILPSVYHCPTADQELVGRALVSQLLLTSWSEVKGLRETSDEQFEDGRPVIVNEFGGPWGVGAPNTSLPGGGGGGGGM